MKKFILLMIFLLLFSCKTSQNKKNDFIALFPTNADVYGWTQTKKPIKTNSIKIEDLKIDIEEYNVLEIYKSNYVNINENTTILEIFILKTKDALSSYGVVNNENTKIFKNIENNILNYKNYYLSMKGEYVIICHLSKIDDSSYQFFKNLELFVKKNIITSKKLPQFLNNFKYEEITFYFEKKDPLISGYFIYSLFLKNEKYEIQIKVYGSKFIAQTEYYNYMASLRNTVIWKNENYNSTFIKRKKKYDFIGNYESIIFMVRDATGIDKGKMIMNDVYFKLKGN